VPCPYKKTAISHQKGKRMTLASSVILFPFLALRDRLLANYQKPIANSRPF
jgi:hypothetical protein